MKKYLFAIFRKLSSIRSDSNKTLFLIAAIIIVCFIIGLFFQIILIEHDHHHNDNDEISQVVDNNKQDIKDQDNQQLVLDSKRVVNEEIMPDDDDISSTSANRQNAVTIPLMQRKNVIVYLVHHYRLSNMFLTSLLALFKYFNNKYKYPVLCFYEEDSVAERLKKRLRKSAALSEEQLALVNFVKVKFDFPENYFPAHGQPANLNFKPVWPQAFPGYHHMINFWFQRIFQMPEMEAVEYYWRIDSDAKLLQPISYNIFELMKNNTYVYGYRVEGKETPEVAVGLWEFIEKFIRQHNIPIDKVGMKNYSNAEKLPIYYNNFEVVHVPTFKNHPGIQNFIKAVVDRNGIYEQRWGDAPLRYFSVNLFFNSSQSAHRFCDIAYRHQGLYEADCKDGESNFVNPTVSSKEMAALSKIEAALSIIQANESSNKQTTATTSSSVAIVTPDSSSSSTLNTLSKVNTLSLNITSSTNTDYSSSSPPSETATTTTTSPMNNLAVTTTNLDSGRTTYNRAGSYSPG